MKQHLACLMMIPAMAAILGVVGGCASHKTATTASNKLQPIPANSFRIGWDSQVKTNGDDLAELHLRKDHLFIYTQSQKVWALSRSGGDIDYLAEPQISGGVLRQPLVLGPYVVYPCGSTLEIFDNHGRPVRTLDLDKPTRSGAAGKDDTIYIGLDHTGGTGVMASIDITKSYKVVTWELMTFGPISATPVLFDKVIYCGSEDGRLYAVAEDRSPVWTLDNGANWFQTQGKFVSDIQADDYGVYASNTDTRLYCLDRQNGHIKWQYFAGAPLRSAPVVMKDTVYQHVPGQGVAAIDKTHGTFNRSARWIVPNTTQFLSEDDQNAYLLGADKTILAVNKQTGEVAFKSHTRPYELFATNTTDSTIFAANTKGDVAAIQPVLTEGHVGHLVMAPREQPLALAK